MLVKVLLNVKFNTNLNNVRLLNVGVNFIEKYGCGGGGKGSGKSILRINVIKKMRF